MSTIYSFDESESLLTSSTTTVMASTDALIVHNVANNKTYQTTVAGVASGPVNLQALTSASTATNILPWGLTTIASSNALSYLITAPPSAGYYKTITTTSTATITCVCSGASLTSSAAGSGSQFIFNSAGGSVVGAGVSLVSVGSTRWVVEAFSPLTIAS